MTPHPLRHTSPHPPCKVPTWLFVLASAITILLAVLFVDVGEEPPTEKSAATERQRNYEAMRHSPEFQDVMKVFRDE